MHFSKWFGISLVALVCLIATSHRSQTSAASPKSSTSERKVQRKIAQSRLDEIKRHDLNLNNLRTSYVDGSRTAIPFDRSILRDGAGPNSAFSASAGAPPPPQSPGLAIAQTAYDYQSNASQGHRVARIGGADIVHFTWMSWDHIPANIDDFDRHASYNSYAISGNVLIQGIGGVSIDDGEFTRGGYPVGDVWDDNSFQAAFHQSGESLPYGTQYASFSTPGSSMHITEALGGITGGCAEAMWPKLATSRDGSRTSHVVAHSNTNDCLNDLLWYWRYNGTAWTGPIVIDSTPHISYVIADDPTGDKLAVVVHVDNWASMNGLNNVAYLESTTDGAGWIAGSESKTKHAITNYSDESGPGAWLHLDACYDHDGILHVAFDEQFDAFDSPQASIRHWNSARNTIRPVALGYWDSPLLTGVYNLNLSKLTMGIGDGSTLCQGGAESNEDYVYILYTQFGGTTQAEQEDASLEGRYNGELYLTVSPTGGNTWGPAVNLTNTKTPNCNPGPADTLTGLPQRPDSVCRSENWATIGMVVSDIDIFFISDKDAGGIPQGEGTWQLNPVMYYRIPGGTTNAQHLCPAIAPNIHTHITSDAECEYHAGQLGQNVETLSIINLGNSGLTGTVSVTDFPGAPTLTVGSPGPYSVPAGAPDVTMSVTMAANGANEGLYSGSIAITHNDPSKPSPKVIPIEFFVFNAYFCPEANAPMVTGSVDLTGRGSLSLNPNFDGSFGTGDEHGLWRRSDSSSAIDDASLLVAHGAQASDTTVFLKFSNRPTNGQAGFRPLTSLIVDISAYGTFEGCATASARMCTKDSVVGVTVDWFYPQDPTLDEFVIGKYKLYRHDPSTPITDLAVGLLVDFDMLPASRLENIQAGATNTPGSDGTRNLAWVGGVDTAGHVPSGQSTASRFRAGVILPHGHTGIYVGNAVSDLQPGGGPTDQLLYEQLTNPGTFIDLYSNSDTDLYIQATFAQGESIAAGETLSYTVILLSDTMSEAAFKAKADLAIANVATLCNPCACPCKYDPQCDGVYSNVQDVVMTIDVAFRGILLPSEPLCPKQRTDVDADGITGVTDVVKVINVSFRGQTIAANYVDPCL